MKEAAVRTIVLAVALVSGFGMHGRAQTPTPASTGSVSLSLMADSVEYRPVHGYDGVVRPGRAEHVTMLNGNVVIEINGVRVTADTAAWYSATNLIELGRGGTTRIQIPGPVTSYSVGPRRP